MALDSGTVFAARLDHIGIQRALHQEVGVFDATLGFLEDPDEGLADGFAFGLSDGNMSNEYVIRYVRVIEAKLKEKNS